MRYYFYQVLKLTKFTGLMNINQDSVNGTLTCTLGDSSPIVFHTSLV